MVLSAYRIGLTFMWDVMVTEAERSTATLARLVATMDPVVTTRVG